MSESSECLDVTSDDEAVRKVPKLTAGYFKKFDANDLEQVAAQAARERTDAVDRACDGCAIQQLASAYVAKHQLP